MSGVNDGVPFDRTPVTSYELAGGAFAVICDDGSMWVCFANGEEQRVWQEGTPVPGTKRAAQRAQENAG